jgi:hypothetical protein
LQIRYLGGVAVESSGLLAQNAPMLASETIESQCWSAAVIMQRTALNNRWASEKWEVSSVVPDLDPGAAPRVILQTPDILQVMFSGLQIRLQRDEAEGYYMNITSPQPKVFVLWRMGEVWAEPHFLSVSYNEGARWLDSSENVDGVPLPVELVAWLADYCEKHYHPEPEKKRKYASNKDKGRMGNWRPDK